MSQRHVYALDGLPRLVNAMDAVRACGVADEHLAVVARHDIELHIDPDAPEPGAHGQLTGLLGGLSAVSVPTLGVSLAGAGLLAYLGGALGNWVDALAPESTEDALRRRYRDEIAAGRILLAVDAAPETQEAVRAALAPHGAELLG